MTSSWLRALVHFVFGPPRREASPESPPDADDDAPFVVPIEDELDLHFFARRDLPSVVDEYLRAARVAGLLEVRLVHGRGKGVARAMVEKIVARSPHAARWAPAPPARGGGGALIVWLRPGPPAPDAEGADR